MKEWTWQDDHLTFEGGGGRVWVISEKKIPADWFRGKKFLAKKTPTLKKKSFMAYEAAKNSYTVVYQEKKLYYQRLGKNRIITQTNSPIPYDPSKVKWSAPKLN